MPLNSSEHALTTFIITVGVFADITGETGFKAIDIQLKNKKDEETVG